MKRVASPRKSTRLPPTYQIGAPADTLGEATLDAVRCHLGWAYPAPSDRLRHVFKQSYLTHQQLLEELERQPPADQIANRYAAIVEEATQIVRAAGSFDSSRDAAAEILELAKREETRLRELQPVQRSRLALRNTLFLLALRLVALYATTFVGPKSPAVPPTGDLSIDVAVVERDRSMHKGLMDAMRAGLEGLGIDTRFDPDHPGRYYELVPFVRQTGDGFQ